MTRQQNTQLTLGIARPVQSHADVELPRVVGRPPYPPGLEASPSCPPPCIGPIYPTRVHYFSRRRLSSHYGVQNVEVPSALTLYLLMHFVHRYFLKPTSLAADMFFHWYVPSRYVLSRYVL